jgi:proteasome accessory factor B
MARLVHGLATRPLGWSFDAIEDELGISERTLLRYVAACREELVDAEGEALIETVRRGDRRLLKLRDRANVEQGTAYQTLFLYFALSIFQFLDGTVIKEGVEGLWDRFAKRLPGPERARLGDFRKKFYTVPYAMKDYREHDDVLDRIVRALVRQSRVEIDYRGLMGGGRKHRFDPYTLLMYRGGLYLLGRSNLTKKNLVLLAVERMRELTLTDERFDYPSGYSPEEHSEGIFGIIAGPAKDVELLVSNPQTLAYLKERRIHPTQRFRTRNDGNTVLSMTVRGTEELKNWVLSFGPYLEVLQPKELRQQMRELLSAARGLYRNDGSQATALARDS